MDDHETNKGHAFVFPKDRLPCPLKFFLLLYNTLWSPHQTCQYCPLHIDRSMIYLTSSFCRVTKDFKISKKLIILNISVVYITMVPRFLGRPCPHRPRRHPPKHPASLAWPPIFLFLPVCCSLTRTRPPSWSSRPPGAGGPGQTSQCSPPAFVLVGVVFAIRQLDSSWWFEQLCICAILKKSSFNHIRIKQYS